MDKSGQRKTNGTGSGPGHTNDLFMSKVEHEKKTIMDRIRLLNNFKTIAGWAEQSHSFYCFQIVTT